MLPSEPNNQPHILEQTGQVNSYDPETVDVDDLGLAATLMLLGVEPAGVRRISFSKVMFEFPDTDDVRLYMDNYFRNDCPVDAHSFWLKLRDMKQLTKNV